MSNVTTADIEAYLKQLREQERLVNCEECHGTGQVLADDGQLDLDSIDAVRAELIDNVTNDRGHGLTSNSRADRIHTLARIGFLASRLVWLESTSLRREEWDAAGKERAEAAVEKKIASGDLVRLVNGGLIEAEKFDPDIHVPANPDLQLP